MSLNMAIALWVTLPLGLAWGIGVSWLIIGYYKSKPTLQQSLIDLVNGDLVFGHAAALSLVLLSFYEEEILIRYESPSLEMLFLLLTWTSQFWSFFTIIYMSYSVIVRYVYIFNQVKLYLIHEKPAKA